MNATAGVSGVDVKFQEAWKLARSSTEEKETVVGVVDTGVDITHADLVNNVWLNPDEIPGNGIDDDRNGYADDIHGYDFAKDTGDITDSGDHGTHVAGTIAAEGGNGMGVIGVQPHAKILPLKVSSDGRSMTTSAVLAALNYAILLKERGVNIVAVNASYGGASATTAERTAIEALRDAGIIMCAAAGNDGTNNDSKAAYPSSYTTSNIISVAALTPGGGLASFSNYGGTSVDLVAPGVNIYSAAPASGSRVSSLTVDGTTYTSSAVEYSGVTTNTGITGAIYNCGLGKTAEFPAAVRGNIALIQRGTTTFAEKVTNAGNAGAAAAIIYDNTSSSAGSGGWTLAATGNWIPALHITNSNGLAIVAKLATSDLSAVVVNYTATGGSYQFLDGTSMAAPHVSGAVAFAALNFPADTLEQRMARILDNVTPLTALSGKVATGGMLNLLGIVDSDGGGLPDWWENVLPDTADEPAADADGDGFTNLQEFLSSTDPSVPGSHPDFSGHTFEQGSKGDFVLSFFGAAGLSYQVEWSNSFELGTWQFLGSGISGNGAIVQVKDSGARFAASRRFYRLRVTTE
ncbi:MAG: S8 family serine peptidase [Verrucomicrobiota bacterium]